MVSHRCTRRAGREHSQAASPSWPMEIFHTIDVMLSTEMGAAWGAGIYKIPVSSAGSTIVAQGQAVQSVVAQ